MATVFVIGKPSRAERNPDDKLGPDTSTTSVNTVPPLGEPLKRKRFWFQKTKAYDPDAVATQASSPRYPDNSENKPDANNQISPASSMTRKPPSSIIPHLSGESPSYQSHPNLKLSNQGCCAQGKYASF